MQPTSRFTGGEPYGNPRRDRCVSSWRAAGSPYGGSDCSTLSHLSSSSSPHSPLPRHVCAKPTHTQVARPLVSCPRHPRSRRDSGGSAGRSGATPAASAVTATESSRHIPRADDGFFCLDQGDKFQLAVPINFPVHFFEETFDPGCCRQVFIFPILNPISESSF
jgi:hypothetical protein